MVATNASAKLKEDTDSGNSSFQHLPLARYIGLWIRQRGQEAKGRPSTGPPQHSYQKTSMPQTQQLPQPRHLQVSESEDVARSHMNEVETQDLGDAITAARDSNVGNRSFGAPL